MPLVSIHPEMIKARQQKYAIPLWDVFDIHAIEGIIDALITKKAPTIIAIYAHYVEMPNGKALTDYIRQRAQDTAVPISLMLDHGPSVDTCLKALELGFSDVMYDGSSLPFEENVANTLKVVKIAHAQGAAVEAELGHVGSVDNYDQFGGQRHGFTDPAMVERFIAETGVDLLAIAFGNAHGLYKGQPCLDLDLVHEIHERVAVPLVMHGGTGLSDEQYRATIAAGICKINYATGILNASVSQVRQALQDTKASFFSITDGIRKAHNDECSRLYDVFGTTGKAS
jgi:fructose-bisphosphate aldolase, class II